MVKADPVPSPPPPASLGNDAVPTTRNGTVREPPVGSCTVTRRTDPTWAPTWCSVVTPSVMSSSPVGSRPSTVDRSIGPRTAFPAMARTSCPLIVTSSLAASMIAVMEWSCCRLATQVVGLPGPPFELEIDNW